jgi:hypothetical protein
MRAATSRAMKSSTSLCRHVCPHKCFDPGRIRFREFHPLTRISPPCSLATNQWFVCFFSAPQMSHEIACRITAFPPGRRTSLRIRQPHSSRQIALLATDSKGHRKHNSSIPRVTEPSPLFHRAERGKGE